MKKTVADKAPTPLGEGQKKRGRRVGSRAAETRGTADGTVQTTPAVRNSGVPVPGRKRKSGSERGGDDVAKRTGKLKRIQPPPDVEQTINFINGVPDEQIPYVLATVLNHRDVIRKHQDRIRLLMTNFVIANFPSFCRDYMNLKHEPALRMRLFAEVSKFVIARPKPAEDPEEAPDSREDIIKRMFGLGM